MNKKIIYFIIILFLSSSVLEFIPSSIEGFFRYVLAATADDLRRAGLDEATVQELLQQAAINQEVKQLDQEIKARKEEIEKKKKQSETYERTIAEKQKQAASLKNQLIILENRVGKTKLDMSINKQQREAAAVELKSLALKINDKEKEISQHQKEIADSLLTLRREQQKNPWEIIFLHRSFSDFFNGLTYTERLSEKLKDLVQRQRLTRSVLEAQKFDREKKEEELKRLEDKLDEQKLDLEQHQSEKNILLDQTRSSEVKYQKLLKEERAEQEAIEEEMGRLEANFRAKLEARGILNGNEVVLNWPVPKAGITAYFHDPTYLFRKVFEHPAIDIRTLKNGKSSNGIPVRASERGYVIRAKDAGLGYSYVVIMHNRGVSTVYGHVSKILVTEGEYVNQGQIIALSGGMPGTHGAGRLTTGPHLHFEVRVKGVAVDPLAYLP